MIGVIKEESEYCTIAEWIQIIEEDLHVPLDEFGVCFSQYQIIKDGLNPVYGTYVSNYSDRLTQKLYAYWALLLDIKNRKMEQYQDFFDDANILYDSLGYLRRSDAHRLSFGFLGTLQALENFERSYRDENQGLKVMHMTGGLLPTPKLLYDEGSKELNVGCIPSSKKKVMQMQQREVRRNIRNSENISRVRTLNGPSCRN